MNCDYDYCMFSSFNSYFVYVFCKALLDFEEAALFKTEFIIISDGSIKKMPLVTSPN